MKKIICFYVLSLLLNEKGMVKLTGPMMSLTALGKFGKAIVYSIWKGIQYARMLIFPTQPRSAAVMNVRIKMLVMGKVSKIFSATSTLKADIKLKIPSGKGWAGWWIGVAIKQFQKDNTDYDTLEADYIACTATTGYWNDECLALGLAAHTLEVNGGAADHPAEYPPGLAVYSMAKACWYMEVIKTGTTAYTDPKLWEQAELDTFLARITD